MNTQTLKYWKTAMLTSVELALLLAMTCTLAGSLAFCRYAYPQPDFDRKPRDLPEAG